MAEFDGAAEGNARITQAPHQENEISGGRVRQCVSWNMGIIHREKSYRHLMKCV